MTVLPTTVLNNDWWLQALRQDGERHGEALDGLREYLLRAVLVYLQHHRSDLVNWAQDDIRHFAEDVAQEALLSIRKNLDNFRGDSKFTTWAYRFAVNQAASELRRSRYRDLSFDKLQDEDNAFVSIQIREQPAADPDLASEQNAFVELFNLIIQDELTERQRLAFVAIHFNDLPMEEVAGQLGISRNALYKLLHDARRKIKAQLEARYLSAGDVLSLFES